MTWFLEHRAKCCRGISIGQNRKRTEKEEGGRGQGDFSICADRAGYDIINCL